MSPTRLLKICSLAVVATFALSMLSPPKDVSASVGTQQLFPIRPLPIGLVPLPPIATTQTDYGFPAVEGTVAW